MNERGSTRLVSGVLAGVAAAMALIMLVEMLNGIIFPMPVIDLTDAEAARRVTGAMPFAAQAVIVAGWLLGGLAGAALAVVIGRRAWAGWFPAGSVLVGGVFNALFVPQPLWMTVGAVAAPLAGGAIGVALTRRYAVP